jgi:hypothetical protein
MNNYSQNDANEILNFAKRCGINLDGSCGRDKLQQLRELIDLNNANNSAKPTTKQTNQPKPTKPTKPTTSTLAKPPQQQMRKLTSVELITCENIINYFSKIVNPIKATPEYKQFIKKLNNIIETNDAAMYTYSGADYLLIRFELVDGVTDDTIRSFLTALNEFNIHSGYSSRGVVLISLDSYTEKKRKSLYSDTKQLIDAVGKISGDTSIVNKLRTITQEYIDFCGDHDIEKVDVVIGTKNRDLGKLYDNLINGGIYVTRSNQCDNVFSFDLTKFNGHQYVEWERKNNDASKSTNVDKTTEPVIESVQTVSTPDPNTDQKNFFLDKVKESRTNAFESYVTLILTQVETECAKKNFTKIRADVFKNFGPGNKMICEREIETIVQKLTYNNLHVSYVVEKDIKLIDITESDTNDDHMMICNEWIFSDTNYGVQPSLSTPKDSYNAYLIINLTNCFDMSSNNHTSLFKRFQQIVANSIETTFSEAKEEIILQSSKLCSDNLDILTVETIDDDENIVLLYNKVCDKINSSNNSNIYIEAKTKVTKDLCMRYSINIKLHD